MESGRIGARASTGRKTSQNLNKVWQIMVSAMCGQGGLSYTERKKL
jgi:hypothetical protein